ncbi:MAG TPA: 23S rRNA (adenine(2503)-C(2))-methyltransferase RlmN [Candidatus Polarisedimenticolia bacterium]|nr:23S rRNA (adenine(2503)-C(2))-methyltransferase RlmN [Candidatus Polarisedimenticolia bacterium]
MSNRIVSSEPADLIGLDRPAIARLVESLGEKPFHAAQIFRWLYARRASSFDQMTDLSLDLRRRLAGSFRIGRPRRVRVQESGDGTRKYLFMGAREGSYEAVFIPEEKRVTFCISPQSGCALDCRFCLTAQLGFVRHLQAGEIVGQVLELLDDNRARIDGRPVNIVMMGMGEALHNYGASLDAVRLLVDPQGLAIPVRRITLSTAGLAPAIEKLAAEPLRPHLAVSLNAADDETRSRIMPINRKYPLDVLLQACRRVPLGTRERLTFEYVLLRGVNDSPDVPARLAALLRRHRLRAKLNLIPFNAGADLPFEEPPAGLAECFRRALVEFGIPASIRRNRGRDISAACGQLALR